MLVYLMGLTDIFTAIMLVTGLRPSIILTFAIAMLAFKGLSSFWGKPNGLLYIMGGADIIAIALLWQGMVLGNIGTAVLMIMLFKGFISFWEIKVLRDPVLNILYVIYKTFRTGAKKVEWKDSISNYVWFGAGKIKDGRVIVPEQNYPKRGYGYEYLKKFRQG